MNRYGIGRPLIRRPGSYVVEAQCKIRVGFRASDEEDAERQFYDFTSAVESHFPPIVFDEIAEIYEEA